MLPGDSLGNIIYESMRGGAETGARVSFPEKSPYLSACDGEKARAGGMRAR